MPETLPDQERDSALTQVLGTIFGEHWVGQARFTTTSEIDALVNAVAVRPGQQILDILCESAGPALYIERRTGCRVIGVDPTPAHVWRARDAAAPAGVSDRVQFLAGDVETLPFPAARFDAIISHNAFVTVQNKLRRLAACRRLLTPGGRLACTAIVDRGKLTSQFDRLTHLTWPLTFTPNRRSSWHNRDECETDIAQPLLTAEDYRAIVELSGLRVLAIEDVTPPFREVSARWCGALWVWEEDLRAELGDMGFTTLHTTVGQLAVWALQGLIGQVRLIAEQAPDEAMG